MIFRADSQDTKLFINDYNLESDWDNNMKLKSLIEWIKRWEADANGKDVQTADVTEEQHKAMAQLYTYVIQKYYEIIPAATKK